MLVRLQRWPKIYPILPLRLNPPLVLNTSVCAYFSAIWKNRALFQGME